MLLSCETYTFKSNFKHIKTDAFMCSHYAQLFYSYETIYRKFPRLTNSAIKGKKHLTLSMQFKKKEFINQMNLILNLTQF